MTKTRILWNLTSSRCRCFSFLFKYFTNEAATDNNHGNARFCTDFRGSGVCFRISGFVFFFSRQVCSKVPPFFPELCFVAGPAFCYSARRFQKVCSQVCCTPPLFCTPRTPRRVSFRVPGHPEFTRFRVFEPNPRRFEGARGVFKSTRGVCFEAPRFSPDVCFKVCFRFPCFVFFICFGVLEEIPDSCVFGFSWCVPNSSALCVCFRFSRCVQTIP